MASTLALVGGPTKDTYHNPCDAVTALSHLCTHVISFLKNQCLLRASECMKAAICYQSGYVGLETITN